MITHSTSKVYSTSLISNIYVGISTDMINSMYIFMNTTSDFQPRSTISPRMHGHARTYVRRHGRPSLVAVGAVPLFAATPFICKAHKTRSSFICKLVSLHDQTTKDDGSLNYGVAMLDGSSASHVEAGAGHHLESCGNNGSDRTAYREFN